MLGSSAGAPNWHQPTAASPSKTSAACARPASTRLCLSARFPAAPLPFCARSPWNHMHQQPPHTPLCFSTSAAIASQVSGPSGRIVYVDMPRIVGRPPTEPRGSADADLAGALDGHDVAAVQLPPAPVLGLAVDPHGAGEQHVLHLGTGRDGVHQLEQ